MKTYESGEVINQPGLACLAIYTMNREIGDAITDQGFQAVGQAVGEDDLSDDLCNDSSP